MDAGDEKETIFFLGLEGEVSISEQGKESNFLVLGRMGKSGNWTWDVPPDTRVIDLANALQKDWGIMKRPILRVIKADKVRDDERKKN